MPPNVRILMKEKIGHGSFDGKLPCFYRHAAPSLGKERYLRPTSVQALHSLVLANYHTLHFSSEISSTPIHPFLSRSL